MRSHDTLSRYTSKVEAVCVNRARTFFRGVLGDRHPYRDCKKSETSCCISHQSLARCIAASKLFTSTVVVRRRGEIVEVSVRENGGFFTAVTNRKLARTHECACTLDAV